MAAVYPFKAYSEDADVTANVSGYATVALKTPSHYREEYNNEKTWTRDDCCVHAGGLHAK